MHGGGSGRGVERDAWRMCSNMPWPQADSSRPESDREEGTSSHQTSYRRNSIFAVAELAWGPPRLLGPDGGVEILGYIPPVGILSSSSKDWPTRVSEATLIVSCVTVSSLHEILVLPARNLLNLCFDLGRDSLGKPNDAAGVPIVLDWADKAPGVEPSSAKDLTIWFVEESIRWWISLAYKDANEFS